MGICQRSRFLLRRIALINGCGVSRFARMGGMIYEAGNGERVGAVNWLFMGML